MTAEADVLVLALEPSDEQQASSSASAGHAIVKRWFLMAGSYTARVRRACGKDGSFQVCEYT